jgi:hypothetical protein
MTTGSGVEFVPQIAVKQMKAFGNVQYNFIVLSHTLPPSATVDGLLGLDFFRERRLIIDFTTGEIELT